MKKHQYIVSDGKMVLLLEEVRKAGMSSLPPCIPS